MKQPAAPSNPVWDHVNLTAALADLKEQQYRILLAVSALADALEARGLISPGELERRAAQADREAERRITRSRAASHHPKA